MPDPTRLTGIVLTLAVVIKPSLETSKTSVCEDILLGNKSKNSVWQVNRCSRCEERPVFLKRRQNSVFVTSKYDVVKLKRVCVNTQRNLQIHFHKKLRLSGLVTGESEGANLRFVLLYKLGNGSLRFVRSGGAVGKIQTFGGAKYVPGHGRKYNFGAPLYATAIRVVFLEVSNISCINLALLQCLEVGDYLPLQVSLRAHRKAVLKKGRTGSFCSVDILRDCPGSCIWYRYMSDGCPTCSCITRRSGLYQTDIRLHRRSELELMNMLAGMHYRSGSRTTERWPKEVNGPNYIVPYIMTPYVGESARSAIAEAIEDFERHTCIRLRERQNEKNYVQFVVSSGCWSDVGINPEGNKISIGRGCDNKGILLHEIMHTIGFWHEHSRPDRDEHIKVILENITPGDEQNFQKFNGEEIDSFGVDYDVKSIMHYESTTFSKNGLPTLVDKFGELLQTQSDELSEGDILRINKMYPCHKLQQNEDCRDRRSDCAVVRELCDSMFLRTALKRDCPLTCGYC